MHLKVEQIRCQILGGRQIDILIHALQHPPIYGMPRIKTIPFSIQRHAHWVSSVDLIFPVLQHLDLANLHILYKSCLVHNERHDPELTLQSLGSSEDKDVRRGTEADKLVFLVQMLSQVELVELVVVSIVVRLGRQDLKLGPVEANHLELVWMATEAGEGRGIKFQNNLFVGLVILDLAHKMEHVGGVKIEQAELLQSLKPASLCFNRGIDVHLALVVDCNLEVVVVGKGSQREVMSGRGLIPSDFEYS